MRAAAATPNGQDGRIRLLVPLPRALQRCASPGVTLLGASGWRGTFTLIRVQVGQACTLVLPAAGLATSRPLHGKRRSVARCWLDEREDVLLLSPRLRSGRGARDDENEPETATYPQLAACGVHPPQAYLRLEARCSMAISTLPCRTLSTIPSIISLAMSLRLIMGL